MAVVAIASGFDESAPAFAEATLTVTSGNIILALCLLDATSDTTLTFSTTAGTTGAWTEVAAVDQYVSGDGYTQEAAYAVASASGSTTVRATLGAVRTGAYIVIVELSNVGGGFDTADYARDTATPWATGAISNANATATRVVIGAWWGGGNGAADTGGGYTDNGTAWAASGFGAFGRVQSLAETGVNSRTGGFNAGSGVSPGFISHFIFSDSGGGGGGSILKQTRRYL